MSERIYPLVLTLSLGNDGRCWRSSCCWKQKMLKNWLRSWQILAPSEINEDPENKVFILAEGTDRQFTISLESAFAKRSYLQGYIQDCIVKRKGNLTLEVSGGETRADVSLPGYRLFRVGGGEVFEVLLKGYILNLASSREITPGMWQHFEKGDEVKVFGVLPFGTKDCEDTNYVVEGLFTFDDDPKRSFQLLSWGDGHMELQHCGLSRGSLFTRVAYTLNGKGYLQTPQRFLSLVGPDNPRYEGKLIFAQP